VTYPGSEQSRSGRIHFGHTTAGILDAGATIVFDDYAQVLQHHSRTPADHVEIVWRPNIADTELNDPSEAASAVIRDRKSSITVSWAGLPVGGLTFHMTAIYEWTPISGLGVGSNVTGKNTSSNTFDQVLDYLSSAGFNYVRHAGMAMGQSLGAGLIGGISRTFGIMPAVGRGRSTAYLAN
jgi:hypothetical protein